jgi:HEAT repeat protein
MMRVIQSLRLDSHWNEQIMNTTLQALQEQLHHPESNMRSQAVLALSRLDDTDALDMLIQALRAEIDLHIREDITWALVSQGTAATQPLIHLLRDEDPVVRHQAAHSLGKVGDKNAVDALIGVLQDDDNAVRLKAVFALGQIGDDRAIPALVGLLDHDHEELQSTLAGVLEGFGAAAVPLLSSALQHEHWQVRERAANVLGLIGEPATLSALAEALHDDYWQVRFAVVTALGSLGSVGAQSALQQIENDPDHQVRTLASYLVKRMKS